jgi:hypothetical protein
MDSYTMFSYGVFHVDCVLMYNILLFHMIAVQQKEWNFIQ